MSETKVTTTKSLNTSSKSDGELLKDIKKAEQAFKGEKLVEVMIPKAFEKTFGKSMYVAINGVHINVPTDGKKYSVPESFAALIEKTLADVR